MGNKHVETIDPRNVNPYQLKWDLKTPCADCPFLKDSPLHDGIRSDLESLKSYADGGNFVHSCHKTHPGADGWSKGYKGAVQNCAGLTIMCIKEDDLTWPMIRAVLKGELAPENMDKSANTFKNIEEMTKVYSEDMTSLRIHIRGKGWIKI